MNKKRNKFGRFIKTRKQQYCKECKKKISFNSKSGLCKSCVVKGKRHPLFGKCKELHHSYIKRPRCIDCGKELYRLNAIRCTKCRSKGSLNPFYIDGRTSLAQGIRRIDEYKFWRTRVYQRDNYTCQECFVRGGDLEVHHIKEFNIILKEFLKQYSQFSPIEDKETLIRLAITYAPFWNIDNGKTLCLKCHNKTKKGVYNGVFSRKS